MAPVNSDLKLQQQWINESSIADVVANAGRLGNAIARTRVRCRWTVADLLATD